MREGVVAVRRMRDISRADDAGGIVIGWLTRLVVVLAVVGVIGFDAVSIAVAHVNIVDDANSAVQAASLSWQSAHNIETAYQAAEAALPPGEEEVLPTSFAIAADGTVRLTVRRTVRTLIVRHLGSLSRWDVVTTTQSGKAISS